MGKISGRTCICDAVEVLSEPHVFSSFQRRLRLDRLLLHELAKSLEVQSRQQQLQVPRGVRVLGAALQRSAVRKELFR
jgi:hypothetical protein